VAATWLTFVLACGELAILYVLAEVLDVGLRPEIAIAWYWVAWGIAIVTKIVVLPIVSLGWIENGGEFRATGWTIPAESRPLPALAAPGPAEAPALAREFSAVHEVPEELRRIAPPSSVQEVPEELRTAR